MTAEASQLNIYQKLYEIRKGVEYIQKGKSGHRYKYADETAILSAIRPLMDEHRVYLDVEMLPPENLNGFVQIGFRFIWVDVDNPEQRLERHIYLQAVQGDPQKIGGLFTYAMRYFLLKFFNVPTDDIDIDAYMAHNGRLSASKVKEMRDLLADHKDLEAVILSRSEISSIHEIAPEKFPIIMNWLERTINERKEADHAAK